jgi:hypothetical protein
MTKKKKMKHFSPWGPRGWFGHPMGKPSKKILEGFGPWEWLNHPHGPKPLIFLFYFIYFIFYHGVA